MNDDSIEIAWNSVSWINFVNHMQIKYNLNTSRSAGFSQVDAELEKFSAKLKEYNTRYKLKFATKEDYMRFILTYG